MKKILIPVDSSEFSERAIEEGKKMANAFGSDVLLLYVEGVRISSKRFSDEDPMPRWVDPLVINGKINAEEMLKAYKESFGESKDKVEILVLHGSAADEIIRIANNTEVDFVIMGSHGIGSTVYRTLIGSIANKVVHHSVKPVLVIR